MKLLKDEIVIIEVLRLKGETNQAIANRLGISEGIFCYHLERQEQTATDGSAMDFVVQQITTRVHRVLNRK